MYCRRVPWVHQPSLYAAARAGLAGSITQASYPVHGAASHMGAAGTRWVGTDRWMDGWVNGWMDGRLIDGYLLLPPVQYTPTIKFCNAGP